MFGLTGIGQRILSRLKRLMICWSWRAKVQQYNTNPCKTLRVPGSTSCSKEETQFINLRDPWFARRANQVINRGTPGVYLERFYLQSLNYSLQPKVYYLAIFET